MRLLYLFFYFFFFNDPATTEIYTLSLHDALPISTSTGYLAPVNTGISTTGLAVEDINGSGIDSINVLNGDRKSTRLNSSHQIISYAVFCLKKKKHITNTTIF